MPARRHRNPGADRPRCSRYRDIRSGSLLVIGLLASLSVFLASCSGAPRDHRLHLTLWSGWTGGEGIAFQKMVNRFNATHNFQVDNLGGVQDDTRTLRAITAGVPPDLFFLWSPPYLGPLATNGAIRSMDAEFHRSGFKDSDFIPAALEMGRMNGRLYSLPYLVDASGFYWNRAVFRQERLDPDRPPATLQDLLRLAIQLTKKDNSGRLTRLGLDLPDIQLIVALFGGRLLDDKGVPTANDPRNVAAYQWYLDLVTAEGGAEAIDAFTAGYGQGQGPNHPFFTGKTAMMVSGEWIPGWVQKYAPQVDYGLGPVPYSATYTGGKGITMVGGNPICIASESRHPEEAWEFVRWTQTRQAQKGFALALNNVPNVSGLESDPQLTKGSRKQRNFGKFLMFASSPKARVIPNSPVMNFYLSELDHARDFVIHGDKTPRQALDDVQHKVIDQLRNLH